jgi:hypothetical protein
MEKSPSSILPTEPEDLELFEHVRSAGPPTILIEKQPSEKPVIREEKKPTGYIPAKI